MIEEFANMMSLDLLSNTEDDGIETERTDGAWSIGLVAGRKGELKDVGTGTPGRDLIITTKNGSVASHISSHH